MSDSSEKLLEQGYQARGDGRAADAERHMLEAVALTRNVGGLDLANALSGLARVERDLRRSDEALQHYAEALSLYRDEGELPGLAHTFRRVGDVHRAAVRPVLAEMCYREAIDLYRNHMKTPPLDLANTLRGLALLKSASGDTAEARPLWEEARDLYALVGVEAGVKETTRRLDLLTREPQESK